MRTYLFVVILLKLNMQALAKQITEAAASPSKPRPVYKYGSAEEDEFYYNPFDGLSRVEAADLCKCLIINYM